MMIEESKPAFLLQMTSICEITSSHCTTQTSEMAPYSSLTVSVIYLLVLFYCLGNLRVKESTFIFPLD